MEVKWSSFHNLYTSDIVKKYVPTSAGVYLLWVKLKNEKWRCIYAGQATNLEERLLNHLSSSETNLCIKNNISQYIVGFEYAEATEQYQRDGIEKFLYNTYGCECNQQDPGGTPIPINLP
jgi:excinuclease UvrABC nuclease subunit